MKITILSRLLALGLFLAIWSPAARAVTSTQNLVLATSNFSFNGSALPDTYVLNQQGAFQSWFYSPYAPSDLASSGNAILVANSSSGTIAKVDTNGGLIGLVSTPTNGISGIAVGGSGDLYVSVSNNREIMHLDPTGNVIGLDFMPSQVGAMAIDGNGRLVFATSSSSFSSPLSLSLFDFTLDAVVSTVSTSFSSINGLEISSTGEIWISGTPINSFSTQVLDRLAANGQILGTINGPSNIGAITLVPGPPVAPVPEPTTGSLIGVGLAAVALARRATAPGRA
jgi:PEP-CTERM motif